MEYTDYNNLLQVGRKKTDNTLIHGSSYQIFAKKTILTGLMAHPLALELLGDRLYWKWIGPNHLDISQVFDAVEQPILIFPLSETSPISAVKDAVEGNALQLYNRLRRLGFLRRDIKVFIYRPVNLMKGVIFSIDLRQFLLDGSMDDSGNQSGKEQEVLKSLRQACQMAFYAV